MNAATVRALTWGVFKPVPGETFVPIPTAASLAVLKRAAGAHKR